MAKKKLPEEHENLERWLVSYGDFITLLFATFVVLYALSQIDITEFGKLEDSIKKAFNAPSLLEGSDSMFDGKDSILDASAADSVIAPLMLEYISQKYEDQSFEDIKDSIDAMKKNGDLDGVDAQITDKGLLISFKDDFLFYSASAQLTDKAMKTLDNIGVLIGEKFALHYIRVEGHTDSQPINSFLYPSNWELSSARASSIVRYLIKRFKFMPNIFTAVGYSDTRPIADNKTPENRAKNRRVEILVLKNKFKGLEHPSASILTQSKKVQTRFQDERISTLQDVTANSDALQRLKSSQKKAVEISGTTSATDFYAEPETDKPKTLSIKNKTLYEQTQKPELSVKNQNLDDTWLNPVKNNKILQKDINKQFDMVGQ